MTLPKSFHYVSTAPDVTPQVARTASQTAARHARDEFALDHGERFGVWGGLSERERRPLARGRAS
jgi:hypothetical protein